MSHANNSYEYEDEDDAMAAINLRQPSYDEYDVDGLDQDYEDARLADDEEAVAAASRRPPPPPPPQRVDPPVPDDAPVEQIVPREQYDWSKYPYNKEAITDEYFCYWSYCASTEQQDGQNAELQALRNLARESIALHPFLYAKGIQDHYEKHIRDHFWDPVRKCKYRGPYWPPKNIYEHLRRSMDPYACAMFVASNFRDMMRTLSDNGIFTETTNADGTKTKGINSKEAMLFMKLAKEGLPYFERAGKHQGKLKGF